MYPKLNINSYNRSHVALQICTHYHMYRHLVPCSVTSDVRGALDILPIATSI